MFIGFSIREKKIIPALVYRPEKEKTTALHSCTFGNNHPEKFLAKILNRTVL